MSHHFMLFLTVIIGSFACYYDLRTGKIPNRLTFSAIVLGLIFHSFVDGLHGFLFSAAGFGVGFGLLLIPYLLGGIGGGDVKLLAAIGALQGSYFVLVTILVGAVAGGAMAMAISRMPHWCYEGGYLNHLGLARVNPQTDKISFSYGVAIFMGLLYAAWYFF